MWKLSMEGLVCKRESLKRRSIERWCRLSSSRSRSASRVCARLRFLAVASANICSRWWLIVGRFSCSSFCCIGVIGVLFGTKNETVVVEQRQGIGGQLVQPRILEAQGWLHLAA